MDNIIKSAIRDTIKHEPDVTALQGIGPHMISKILETMNTMLSSSFPNTKENATSGLVFVKGRRCTPAEITWELGKPNGKETGRLFKFDITKNTLTLCKFTFKAIGEEFSITMRVPYTDSHGRIWVSGTPYTVTGVLTDRFLSPTRSANKSSVFVRFLKGKHKVQKVASNSILENDEPIDINIVSTRFYNNIKNQLPRMTKMEPTLFLHMLARYGLDGATRLLTDDKITVCTTGDLSTMDLNGKTVYKSTGNPPRNIRKRDHPLTDRAIVVNNITHETRLIASNLIYIFEYFPSIDIKSMYGRDIWVAILAQILVKRQDESGIEEVKKHTEDLDKYIDKIMSKRIENEFGNLFTAKLGDDSSEFYRILAAIVKRFDVWVNAADVINSTALDKRIEVLYYVLYPFISKLNILTFELIKKKGKLRPIGIMNLLKTKLTSGLLFGIRNDNEVINAMTHCSDNMFIGTNKTLGIQLSSANTQRRTKRRIFTPDSTTLLHPSHLIAGNGNSISKNRLSCLSSLNPYIRYDIKTEKIQSYDDVLERTLRLRKVLNLLPRCSNSIMEMPIEFSNKKQT